MPGGQLRALSDSAVAGGQTDQVHPVELVADVAPGVVGDVFHHPQQQQREPAQLDVRADPVFAVVEHRPQTSPPSGTTNLRPCWSGPGWSRSARSPIRVRGKSESGEVRLTSIHHRQSPAWLLEDSVDVAVVWRTEATYHMQTGAPLELVEIDPAHNQTGYYAAAVCAGTPHPGAADEFLQYLTGPAGRSIYQQHRFTGPHPPQVRSLSNARRCPSLSGSVNSQGDDGRWCR